MKHLQETVDHGIDHDHKLSLVIEAFQEFYDANESKWDDFEDRVDKKLDSLAQEQSGQRRLQTQLLVSIIGALLVATLGLAVAAV